MNIFKKIAERVIIGIGKVHWKTSTQLSDADQQKIRELLVDNYYVILTRRKNHLSTFFVGLANFALTFKWGTWSHALMNLEDKAYHDSDFRIVAMGNTRELMESTGEGVHVTPFEQVFDVHAAALLKPKNMTLAEWTTLLDRAKSQLGKKYDTLFNLASDQELSCVELVRVTLQGLPDYAEKFPNFEALIKKRKNLTPQMFYDCGDFEVVFEARV